MDLIYLMAKLYGLALVLKHQIRVLNEIHKRAGDLVFGFKPSNVGFEPNKEAKLKIRLSF